MWRRRWLRSAVAGRPQDWRSIRDTGGEGIAIPWSIDELLVMTVHPGFGGQPFLTECCRRFVRSVDSTGVANHCGWWNQSGDRPAVRRAGANVLVAGNSLFRHKRLNLAEAIAELRKHATD